MILRPQAENEIEKKKRSDGGKTANIQTIRFTARYHIRSDQQEEENQSNVKSP